jgi:GNAT superfamily N-acetyltransferase
VILPFNCGDNDLDDFLTNAAKRFQQDLLAVTYILEDPEKKETVAFFSLFNDNISAQNFDDKEYWINWRLNLKKGKRFKSYPAIKIGRLAVSESYQSLGLGSSIINIIKVLFILENRTGCRYITVDAYSQSLRFYENNGFSYFGNADAKRDTRQMYYDLSLVLRNFTAEELETFKISLLPELVH